MLVCLQKFLQQTTNGIKSIKRSKSDGTGMLVLEVLANYQASKLKITRAYRFISLSVMRSCSHLKRVALKRKASGF